MCKMLLKGASTIVYNYVLKSRSHKRNLLQISWTKNYNFADDFKVCTQDTHDTHTNVIGI